jgi:hypothetical protein
MKRRGMRMKATKILMTVTMMKVMTAIRVFDPLLSLLLLLFLQHQQT